MTADSRDGDYELGDLLGRGGMGRVFHARHRSGRQVVVKRLRLTLERNSSMLDRFGNEARLSQRVQHPNVVRVLERGTATDGLPFIVMDHVPGEALDKIIKSGGPLPLRRVANIGRQVLRGLGAIHEAGVVHADIKSSNIMVDTTDGSDRVTIIDFGLARTMTSKLADDSDVIAGTPEYMAPEVIGGALPNVTSDVYAAGIILYEMLVGATPFSGSPLTQIFTRQLTESVRLPANARYLAATSLERVILRALDKEPHRRFPTARAFAAAFDHAIDELDEARVWEDERAQRTPATITVRDIRPLKQQAEVTESDLVQRRRAELHDVLGYKSPDPLIVAYLGLADALIAEQKLAEAAEELEGALALLAPSSGPPPASLWRISLLLAALHDRLGNTNRARQAASEAHAQAAAASSTVGIERTNMLLRRLAVTRKGGLAKGSAEHLVRRR